MPVSEKKRITNDRYNAKCDTINIRPLKPIGEKIRGAAKASGKSLQGYILDAVNKQIAFDESGENEIDEKVIINLMAWLKEHGHDEKEVLDCLSSLSKEIE